MIPFRILFWNMGFTARPSIVGALASDYQPDIIVLVESKYGTVAIVEELFLQSHLQYQIPFSVTDQFQVFVRMPGKYVEPVFEGDHITIRHVRPVLGQCFILAALHLPSKLHLDRDNQASLCPRWIQSISQAENRTGHSRTVVIGDLNMNPFEPGMVGSEGFHALSSRAIASRRTRRVLGEHRPIFYNPMWSMMGDANGLPGTYYYPSSDPISYFWNTFDQVLLRPDLALHFDSNDVVVVSSVANGSLLSQAGIPNKQISDHLPIVVTLHLEDT